MTGSNAFEARASGQAFELVLASTSPYRRALLERLGVPFRATAPICDESLLKAEERNPVRLAERLAHDKAASVFKQDSGATVIGGDQVVSFQGLVLGKPLTAERAIEQLLSLSGQTHELITAIVVINGARIFSHTDVTKLRMRSLSRPAIERYVGKERPLDCAGSYKIESQGIALFERIESEDQTAIPGLPLIALVSILRQVGFEIP
jgi:7-methyl-GTP pyrophosphatase